MITLEHSSKNWYQGHVSNVPFVDCFLVMDDDQLVCGQP